MGQKKNKGLFDEEFRLDKISKQRDPLERLAQHIDFEVFRNDLDTYFDRTGLRDESKGGRPPYDSILMFKIMVLQQYYNLSDESMEYALLDRLSFMRFLGLGLHDRVPDARTIWHFRNELAQGNQVKKLFKKLNLILDRKKIIVHKGSMVDATIVEVPVQRNSREENQQIKDGEIPDGWTEHRDKFAQKDTDARWVKHNNKKHYGYKNHVKADEKSKLITNYEVTPANIHDSEKLIDLLDNKDKGQPLFADSAYRSDEIEIELTKRHIISRIHEKGYRNKPLSKSQVKRNRQKSKRRARVEHIFGFMTNSMNRIFIRSIGFVRSECLIGLKNITYNLFRLVQLGEKLT